MRVLLATDDSDEARAATVWLRDLPLPPETAICVVTVATLHEPPSDSRSLRDLRGALRAEARRAGERAAALIAERWPRVEIVVAEGDAQVEILHVADEMGIDMAVVGARGLGPVGRFLGGSTSFSIARYALCPVAVVQGPPRRLQHVLVAVDDSPATSATVAFLSRFELAGHSRATFVHVLSESAATAEIERRLSKSSPMPARSSRGIAGSSSLWLLPEIPPARSSASRASPMSISWSWAIVDFVRSVACFWEASRRPCFTTPGAR